MRISPATAVEPEPQHERAESEGPSEQRPAPPLETRTPGGSL